MSFKPKNVVSLQVACIVRVPTEVVKQRAQANKNLNSYNAFLFTLKDEVGILQIEQLFDK